MTDPPNVHADAAGHTRPPAGDRLERYLDGAMEAGEAAEFAEAIRRDPALQRQVDLQTRIDRSLGEMFAVTTPSHAAVAAALVRAGAKVAAGAAVTSQELELARPTGSACAREASAPAVTPAVAGRKVEPAVRSTRRYWAAAILATAAALGWALVGLPWSGPRRDAPLFAARPLVDIYNDAVASGFEPTYECREPERFAATFFERQGKPLQLLTPPVGTRMLGLAYVGGLSRQTTAMLCLVDGERVMVFVDRAAADQAIASDLGDAKLHVFRHQRDGLVFYEVTPLAEPRVTQLLAPLSEA
jgi:hypothetical protein